MILTAITAKTYNALSQFYLTRNQKNSQEKSKWLSEKSIHDLADSDYQSNHQRCVCKRLKTTQLLIDFSKALDSIC